MSSIFWYQPNVAVSGNLGGKVPVVDNVLSSKQQVMNLTASIDQNYLKFEFQTDRNHYVDSIQKYMASKLKLANVSGYKTCNTKNVKKTTKKKQKRIR